MTSLSYLLDILHDTGHSYLSYLNIVLIMATAKRKVLTLEQRVEAIRLLDSGKAAYKIAADFGVGKTQIQNLRKRKAELLSDYEQNVPGTTKRRRMVTGNEEINELCLKWFRDAVGRRINVTGPLLKEKALKFAKDLGNESFKASNGWLESFLGRNNIKFGTMSGERGDVNNKTVDDWNVKLPNICENFHPKDIFNMDETGLFFKDTSKKTFHFSGEDCAGGKMSKERITVSLCASMLGEKITPLVIGKSRKPRCFSNIEPSTLPVIYRNNKKAWMTSNLYEEYLNTINKKMKRQKRNILLFVDNAPSHPDMKFSNITVKFLPPNTTSKTQPMDQGIIQATKLKFRKRQLTHMVSQMDKQPSACGSELLKQISVLDAIYWISSAWEEVEKTTIMKCFKRCGFQMDQEMNEEEDDEDIPLAVLKRSKEIFGYEFRELIEVDKDICTTDNSNINWDKSAAEILKEKEDSSVDEDDNDEDAIEESAKTISKSEASDMIFNLKQYAKQTGSSKIFEFITKAEDEINASAFKCAKQTVISEFLKRH